MSLMENDKGNPTPLGWFLFVFWLPLLGLALWAVIQITGIKTDTTPQPGDDTSVEMCYQGGRGGGYGPC